VSVEERGQQLVEGEMSSSREGGCDLATLTDGRGLEAADVGAVLRPSYDMALL
jgi:hypothetical protein